jgi:hypothetical protein
MNLTVLVTLVSAVVVSAFMAWTIGAGSTGSTPFAPAVGANAISTMRAAFVVGIFGMNFGEMPFNMPELAWPYAYPAVTIGMGPVAVVLAVYFRREGWL